MWVPRHHGMARPQIVDGREGLHILRVAANMKKKQSRTADKGWSSSLVVGRVANDSQKFVVKCYTRPRSWRVLANMSINLRVP
jgi:hypothetical protein